METIGTTASAAPIFIKLNPLVSSWDSLPAAPQSASAIKTRRLVEKFPLIRKAEHFVGGALEIVVVDQYDGVVRVPQRIGGSQLAAKSKKASKKSRGKGKSKNGSQRGVNQNLVKALAHELRVEILAILNERMASPNELAKELNEGLSQVSYHVKVLKDYNCIELVKTEPRRGAVEHYYRATSRAFLTDRDWHQLPDSVRTGMSADLFKMIMDDVVASLEDGTFDERKDRHMSWTPMFVDEKGWADIRGILGKALKDVMAVQAECVKRTAKADTEGFNVSVAMLGYEVPEAAAKKPLKKKAKARSTKAKK